MNQIRVVGSDWDTAMLSALHLDPPPKPHRVDDHVRHMHVANLLIETIGADLASYLRQHGQVYLQHWRRTSDPITTMAAWLTDYYLTMNDVITAGPAQTIGNWPAVVANSQAARDTQLGLFMQFGYTLLLPLALEEATGQPAYPIVHDHNPFVYEMYAERLPKGRPLLLNQLTRDEVKECLHRGIVCANLDTAYPGTRTTVAMPLLGHTLVMPAGLLDHASRLGLTVRAFAGPGAAGTIDVAVSPVLTGDRLRIAGLYARHFERWISQHPEQWMAWSSLSQALPAGI